MDRAAHDALNRASTTGGTVTQGRSSRVPFPCLNPPGCCAPQLRHPRAAGHDALHARPGIAFVANLGRCHQERMCTVRSGCMPRPAAHAPGRRRRAGQRSPHHCLQQHAPPSSVARQRPGFGMAAKACGRAARGKRTRALSLCRCGILHGTLLRLMVDLVAPSYSGVAMLTHCPRERISPTVRAVRPLTADHATHPLPAAPNR